MLNEKVLTSFLRLADSDLILKSQRFDGFHCGFPTLLAQQPGNLLLNPRSTHGRSIMSPLDTVKKCFQNKTEM